MKNLKRLSTAVLLTLVLGVSTFAGETPTGPCAPPAPGEVNTPPCAAAQIASDNWAAPGEVETPPASNTVIVSLVGAAMDLLLFF